MSDKEFSLHHDDGALSVTTRINYGDRYRETVGHQEKHYEAPEASPAVQLKRILGNPTPIALCGFILVNTPAAIDLMGWRGAGGDSGNDDAGVATYFFTGGLLLLFGGLGEFILGNTFSSVLFFNLGGFWLSIGGTITPGFAAKTSYDNIETFDVSFSYYYLIMGVVFVLYSICALRTNICLFLTMAVAAAAFFLLAGSYMYAGEGNLDVAHGLTKASGACLFVVSMFVIYIFLGGLLETVDFPVSLPTGDLSTTFLGKAQRAALKRDRRRFARSAV